MTDTRNKQVKKYVIYCLFILIAELLQNVSGIIPEIFGARCFLIIPTVMILTSGEGELSASLLGLFAGALWDISSATHMGFNCIFFALTCFIASALVNNIIRNTFITNIIICSTVAVLYSLVYWLCFIVIKGTGGEAYTLFAFYLPSVIYTVAASAIAYFIFKPIKARLKV